MTQRMAQAPGFLARPQRTAEIAAYMEACRPMAQVRPGMLSNPMAATNWRSVSHIKLTRRMPDPDACISTPSVADLPWALDYLLFAKGCNVLVINGGDGTIHHTVNAAIATVAAASEQVGAAVPLPRFLFVNGGGMNMLARAFRTRGYPLVTLRRLLARLPGAVLGDLPTLSIPALKVTEGASIARYGFIFGSELVLNALFMYERFGRGYRGLTRFFTHLVSAYAFKTELWHRFGHLLDPPTTVLHVDEVTHTHYASVVVATAPMTLLRGLVGTLPHRSEPGDGMNTIEILPTSKGGIIGTIPHLLRGRSGTGIRYGRKVQSVRLKGRYTLDGELFERPGEGSQTSIEVTPSAHAVQGIWLP